MWPNVWAGANMYTQTLYSYHYCHYYCFFVAIIVSTIILLIVVIDIITISTITITTVVVLILILLLIVIITAIVVMTLRQGSLASAVASGSHGRAIPVVLGCFFLRAAQSGVHVNEEAGALALAAKPGVAISP